MSAIIKKTPWWQWALLSVSISVMLVISTLATLVALAFQGFDVFEYVYVARPPYITDGMSGALLALLIAGQSLIPVLALLLFRPSRTTAGAGLHLPSQWGGTIRRLGFGILLATALQALWGAVGPKPAEHWRVVHHLIYAVKGGGAFWPAFWLVLAIGVVGPFAEEVLFRGFLLGSLRRRWGFAVAAILSSLCFGISHGLTHSIPTALLGFYFAWQVEKDGSLCGALALHVLNNLAAILLISASF